MGKGRVAEGQAKRKGAGVSGCLKTRLIEPWKQEQLCRRTRKGEPSQERKRREDSQLSPIAANSAHTAHEGSGSRVIPASVNRYSGCLKSPRSIPHRKPEE